MTCDPLCLTSTGEYSHSQPDEPRALKPPDDVNVQSSMFCREYAQHAQPQLFVIFDVNNAYFPESTVAIIHQTNMHTHDRVPPLLLYIIMCNI